MNIELLFIINNELSIQTSLLGALCETLFLKGMSLCGYSIVPTIDISRAPTIRKTTAKEEEEGFADYLVTDFFDGVVKVIPLELTISTDHRNAKALRKKLGKRFLGEIALFHPATVGFTTQQLVQYLQWVAGGDKLVLRHFKAAMRGELEYCYRFGIQSLE